jgi:hypothetical protein
MIENLFIKLGIFWDTLLKNAPLLSALGTLFAALVALYLGSWRDILRKPKLRLYFNEKKEYPYFHNLAFDAYPQIINFIGQEIYILKPGFNARIKIYNKGKTTAKSVQARVEKIILKDKSSIINSERIYHPTTVKWSGEKEWNPIDIVPKSHFFLDIFWSNNEMPLEITNFNHILYREEINKNILEDIIENDISPSGEVYWNVWVESPYNRGIPSKYDFEGDISIHFILNGENCGPLRFQALVNWTFSSWNSPNIKIKQGRSFINND